MYMCVALQTNESMKNRLRMERELDKVQSLMSGLSEQGAHLQQTINSLRKSEPDLSNQQTTLGKRSSSSSRKAATYMETDLDTMQQSDLSKPAHSPSSSLSPPGAGHFNKAWHMSLMRRPRDAAMSRSSVASAQGLTSSKAPVTSHSRSFSNSSESRPRAEQTWASQRDLQRANTMGARPMDRYKSDSDVRGASSGVFAAKPIFVQSPAANRKSPVNTKTLTTLRTNLFN